MSPLKDFRYRHRMTQAEFARAFRIPVRTVEKWEYLDRRCASLEAAMDLYDALSRIEGLLRGGGPHDAEEALWIAEKTLSRKAVEGGDPAEPGE